MVNESEIYCYDTNAFISNNINKANFNTEINDTEINDTELNNTQIKTIELGNGFTVTYPTLTLSPFFINSIFLLMGIIVGISISTLIVSIKK